MDGPSKTDQGQNYKDFAPRKNYSDKTDWKEGSNKYDRYDNQYKQGSKYYNNREDKPSKKDYYGGKSQGYVKVWNECMNGNW